MNEGIPPELLVSSKKIVKLALKEMGIKIPIALSQKIKVKSKPILNRPSHSSATDASSAHLRFRGPETAVCRRCLACRTGSHSITCHPIQVNPSLPYTWEEDLRILLP